MTQKRSTKEADAEFPLGQGSEPDILSPDEQYGEENEGKGAEDRDTDDPRQATTPVQRPPVVKGPPAPAVPPKPAPKTGWAAPKTNPVKK